MSAYTATNSPRCDSANISPPVPGKVYPYNGAKLSMVAITAAKVDPSSRW
jgi:hypothetical protein